MMQTYPVRRKDRILPEEEASQLLERGEYGFLATIGKDGVPYAVPLSYVVLEGNVYFHCALDGRKVDNLRFCPKVSFAVVGNTQPIFDKTFTTYYESAIAFGTVDEVSDAEEKFRVLYLLSEKYLPDHMSKAPDAIQSSLAKVSVYRLEVASVTGKVKRPQP